MVALILSKLLGKKFIPLYYGSSFSYIAATLTLTQASFGTYAGEELVRLAQVGKVAPNRLSIFLAPPCLFLYNLTTLHGRFASV